jgi:general secretion pathway protein D
MEQPKLISLRIRHTALLASACLAAPLVAQEPAPISDHAQREISRRSLAVDEAQELLKKGDEAYLAGRYEEAVEAYAGARELLPAAPLTAELRAAATDRFAQASVEHGRSLVRAGDRARAITVMERVLAPTVAPDHAGARTFRAELDDPIRTNPALTYEHTRNVDEVRRLLYTAEGAYNLGDFNKARSTYQDVLRIDPTNTAARRGMERVAAEKGSYYRSAYDHTRAELLNQVGAAWELQVAPAAIDPTLLQIDAGLVDRGFIPVDRKLDRIVIPSVQLDQANIDEAIDFLRARSFELDTLETDPARRGVNFTVNLGEVDSDTAAEVRNMRFNLNLTQVPVSQVLRYITDMTRTTYVTDDFAVTIRPFASGSEGMIRRTYRVPPDFISSLSRGAAAGTAEADPFAAPASAGLLTRRPSAREVLEAQSIRFPEGASAIHSPTTNTLMVVNTAANQEIVAQLIDSIAQTEPIMVAVRVTIIRTEQSNLQEIGYDWLLSDFNLGADGRMRLSGGTQGSGGLIDDIAAVGALPSNPITSGLRSGDQAVTGNSIDTLIQESSTGERQGPAARAPGILGVNGLVNNGIVQGLLRGLDRKKGTDIMSQPSMITRNGQASSIVLSREFIYPTEYEPPELPNQTSSQGGSFPVTPATPTAFTKTDVGLTLDVLPMADANKQFVEVTLNPTITDFDGFVNFGSPIYSTTQVLGVGGGQQTQRTEITNNAILMPVFSTQRATTNVIVADGATIVIGGMLRDSIETVEDKVPVIGDLPVVGRFFQSRAHRPVSTAIIFLVNVELMDPTGRRFNQR